MDINEIISDQAHLLAQYVDQLRSYYNITQNHEISVKNIYSYNYVYKVIFEINPSKYLYNIIYKHLDQFKKYLINQGNLDIILLNLNITNERIFILVQFNILADETLQNLKGDINNYYEIKDFINYYNDSSLKIIDLINMNKLSIEYTNITKLPESIGILVNLKKLRFSNNKLTELPYSIGNLINLEKLYVGNNKLTSLPESIGSLIYLKELNLENNEIKYLPNTIGNLNKLTKLVLNKNKLKKIPETIGMLNDLKYLYLSFNNLEKLPESMNNLTNLRVVSLKGNKLRYISQYIRNVTDLESIKTIKI